MEWDTIYKKLYFQGLLILYKCDHWKKYYNLSILTTGIFIEIIIIYISVIILTSNIDHNLLQGVSR